jgi:predicted anti-sigma-YlaC factor YlaD
MSDSCEAYRKLIPRDVLADLSGEEQHDLAQHLQECPGCRLERNQYENTLACLGSLEDAPVPRHFFVKGA